MLKSFGEMMEAEGGKEREKAGCRLKYVQAEKGIYLMDH